jgi:hypothetical protein
VARRVAVGTGWLLASLAVWAGAPAVGCPSGLDVGGVLEGDLGAAPGGAFEEIGCVEIANDLGLERREVAWSGVPVPRELGLLAADGLVVVGPGERRLAAQLDVFARWGGPVDDPVLAIRWLEVSVPARVGAGGTSVYSLRRYSGPPAPVDPFAASVATGTGGRWTVDTGLATFTLDPANPALLDEIAIDLDDDGAGRTSVYQHAPGAGPRLVVPGAGGADLVLGTAIAGAASVDPGGFEWVETGPVKAVAVLRGHLADSGGSTLCTRDGLAYERFGYTLVATFLRGSRHVRLGFTLRNECSDALGGPWTDDAVTVRRASWELPFGAAAGPGGAVLYHAGAGAAAAAPSGSAAVRVEQRHGAGSPWLRRARVVVDGATLESAEAFERPFAALAGPAFAAAVQLGWMRFREPQALVGAADGTLSIEVVGQEILLGEGKGLWNHALVGILPAGASPAATLADLEALRVAGAAELERGLLVRAPAPLWNAAGLYPSLGLGGPSAIAAAYGALMEELHDQTVAPGGQWHRAKTFGAQLWPDVQYDLWSVDHATPAANSGAMNYWNPSGAELLELFRTGDPKWAWDFALPQSWLQMHTAYLNVGDESHGNRAGFAVTSGGDGAGHWHRSAFGSDDYSYDMGMHLAYALRPDPALRDRFAQAGRTAVERYSIPEVQEGTRERFVDQVDLTRQVIQHFWLLADCAELVPGARGQTCHDRLLEVVAELARDNLKAGVLCEGDDPPPGACSVPQQFMQNALMVPFLDRMARNYGDVEGLLVRGIVESARALYTWGLPKQADGVSLAVGGSWAAGMDCALSGAGTAVASCAAAPDSDGNLGMYNPTKPHTVAVLLMAQAHDGSLGLCDVARAAYDDPALAAGWQEFLGNDSGWWKGAAQMVQSMAFGVGLYDTCRLCAIVEALELAARTVSTAETFEACRTIRAGSGFEVVAPGHATLRAGERIVLGDGFSVGAGGRLTVEVDPTLQP